MLNYVSIQLENNSCKTVFQEMNWTKIQNRTKSSCILSYEIVKESYMLIRFLYCQEIQGTAYSQVLYVLMLFWVNKNHLIQDTENIQQFNLETVQGCYDLIKIEIY